MIVTGTIHRAYGVESPDCPGHQRDEMRFGRDAEQGSGVCRVAFVTLAGVAGAGGLRWLCLLPDGTVFAAAMVPLAAGSSLLVTNS